MGGVAYALVLLGYIFNLSIPFLFGSELDQFFVNSIFKARGRPPVDE